MYDFEKKSEIYETMITCEGLLTRFLSNTGANTSVSIEANSQREERSIIVVDVHVHQLVKRHCM